MALEGPQGFHPNVVAPTPLDTDRGRVVDVLATAFAEGRLDGTEHRRRVELALRATSYYELSALTADLPGGAPPVPVPYPMPPYGYAMYPPPYLYRTSPPIDGCSIAALVCALVTPLVWYLFGIPAIAAIVCGHIALARAARHGSGSRGMALTGLIIGYIEVLFGALVLVAIFASGGS